MSKRLIVVLGCLLCTLSLSTSNEVPSIAISCGSTPLSTLPEFQQSMDTLVYKKLISSLWNENTKIVMVMKDELSLEDFTMKDTHGHSLLQLFENSADRRFFPSVNQPEKAIEMLSKNGFSIQAYNDQIYNNGSEKTIALVDFNEKNDNDDSRQSTLKQHNDDISKIYDNLCNKFTNVILILTGKLNPWAEKTEDSNAHHLIRRHLMAADSKAKPLVIMDQKKKTLIYSATYPTLSIANEPAVELKPVQSDVTLDESRKDLLKVGKGFLVNGNKIILRFRFVATGSYWKLENIEYENLKPKTPLEPRTLISAPKGLSYFSQGPVIFSSNGITLTFNNKFQVQPWMSSASTGSVKFSEPEVQNAFFSAPILAGLFVTFILLFIVTWGIIMIMDIKTMDRFDDPKGKTISINVVE